MALLEIINECCENAIESLKNLNIDFIVCDYLKSKFKSLVFNQLAEKLEDKNYKFTLVYEEYIQVYYEKYNNILENIYKNNL